MTAPTPADELDQAMSGLANTADTAADHATGSLTQAADAAGQVVGQVDPVSGALVTAAGPVMGGLAHGQVDLANGALQAGGAVVSGQLQATQDIAGGLLNGGGDLVDAAGKVLDDQAGAYQDAGSDLLDGVAHGDPLGGLTRAGGDILLGDAKQVGDILTGVGAAATDIGSGVFHGVGDVLGGLEKGAEHAVSGVLTSFGDAGKGVLTGAAHGLESLFGGGDSKSEIIDKFGHEDPKVLDASRAAAENGSIQLRSYASSLNGGDSASVGTADELLKAGAAGLDYFRYFLPAYNAWTSQSITVAQLVTAYEQESGMSFAAYLGDAALLGRIGTGLNGCEQNLQSAYNALVPTWQGQAAANFEAKAGVFFQGASATQHLTTGVGQAVTALAEGLQKLVLAKAETINGLYADTLDPGIDGAMAQTMVKVAQNNAPDEMKRVVLGIFHIEAHGRHAWDDDDNYYSDDKLDDPSRQAAINAAAAWCNQVLVTQTEARLKVLTQVCTQTQQRIQQAFAKVVGDITAVKDPFAGMTTATAPAVNGDPEGSGSSAGGTGGGAPSVPGGGGGGATPVAGGGGPTGGFSVPTPPSGASATTTTPQGVSTTPVAPVPTTGGPFGGGTTDPSGGLGITRPAGLPTGAGWIPAGVPLPNGWTEDPTTGEVLPKGWRVDPTTGLPTPGSRVGTGSGSGLPGSSTGAVDPAQDIHKNKDGSVSLGPDRGLTISPEKGKNGVFTLTDTDTAGVKHTYRVHFDAKGDPVVTEVVPKDGAGLDESGLDTSVEHLSGGAPTAAAGFAPAGGGAVSGGAGGSGGASGFGAGGVVAGAAAAHSGTAAGTHTEALPDGAHVGADNAIGAAGAGAQPASTGPTGAAVAGGESGSGGQHAGVGGVPMGAGIGRGAGGQQQEAGRRYQQRGDVVGEDDVEQWQRMGPVIGEQ